MNVLLILISCLLFDDWHPCCSHDICERLPVLASFDTCVFLNIACSCWSAILLSLLRSLHDFTDLPKALTMLLLLAIIIEELSDLVVIHCECHHLWLSCRRCLAWHLGETILGCYTLFVCCHDRESWSDHLLIFFLLFITEKPGDSKCHFLVLLAGCLLVFWVPKMSMLSVFCKL